ncbi:TPA: hypothetical protein HA244_02345 [Candidatus Micrarchaeota archaeon]|nr:hypothetical protein [Candidatus Micrarchaeota archaeon]
MASEFQVYFNETAFNRALGHFSQAAERGLEALGFLLGNVFSFDGSKYVLVEDYVTADNDATAVSVSFSPTAFERLAQELKQKQENVIVGWAHSHPSYGCFLSSTDVRTQTVFFPEDFHFALVCDPVRAESKAFKVRDGRTREVSFAVVRKK